MAEQNLPPSPAHRRRGYVIVHGKIAFEGKSAEELNNNNLIRKFYLGLVRQGLGAESQILVQPFQTVIARLDRAIQ